jgi:HEAT repeat protein
MRMRTQCAVLGTATLLSGALLGGVGYAKGDAPAKAPAAQLAATTLSKLKSQDPAQIREALDDARLVGAKATPAVPLVASLLNAGLPYPLAQSAIDTLGDIGSADGLAALLPYAHHRDPKVRRAAVRATARVAGASNALALTTLTGALSDPDIQVRAAAATGLGSLKSKSAVKDLFLALHHRIYEAAVSIGQVCDPQDCDALVAELGAIPFDVITTGFDAMLFRPNNEVSEAAKVALVVRMRDVGTRDANKFLRGIQGRWPKNGSEKVKRELDAAVLATMASPGSDP